MSKNYYEQSHVHKWDEFTEDELCKRTKKDFKISKY